MHPVRPWTDCISNILLDDQADAGHHQDAEYPKIPGDQKRDEIIERHLGPLIKSAFERREAIQVDDDGSQWQVERRFHPTMPRERAQELMARWERAVRQTVAR